MFIKLKFGERFYSEGTNFVVYTLGLVAAFLLHVLAPTEGTALLLPGPIPLFLVSVVAAIRGDFMAMWHGRLYVTIELIERYEIEDYT